MLTKKEKKMLELAMEDMITANAAGINTKVLNNCVYQILVDKIPGLNMHHIAGMLSWVYKKYDHMFLVKSRDYSIIV